MIRFGYVAFVRTVLASGGIAGMTQHRLLWSYSQTIIKTIKLNISCGTTIDVIVFVTISLAYEP